MPITITPSNRTIPFRVFKASSFFSRLVGLLGTFTPLEKGVLVFTGCRSIHTFGMMYPIDVAFVNDNGRVLDIESRCPPSRILNGPADTHAVLEFPPGTLVMHNIFPGSVLDIATDASFSASIHGLLRVINRPLNIMISIILAYASLIQLLTVGGRISLPEYIPVLIPFIFALSLFVTRTPRSISTNVVDWILPVISGGMFVTVFCTGFTLRGSTPFALLSLVGLIIYIGAYVSIGRNYGIIPARRKIAIRGLYRFIRHPMYTGKAIILAGQIALMYSPARLSLAVLIILLDVFRAIREERILENAPDFIIYRRYVRYRFIPGIY